MLPKVYGKTEGKEGVMRLDLADLRLFIATPGADSPRPIKLRQKPSTGEWFLWEYSSPLSGIRIPAAQDPWA